MSTVVLRGTLHKDDSITTSATGGSSSSSNGATAEWQWKGSWAFGTSIATIPESQQRPFLYTFQGPADPKDVEIPGIIHSTVEDNAEDDHKREENPNPTSKEGEELPENDETQISIPSTTKTSSQNHDSGGPSSISPPGEISEGLKKDIDVSVIDTTKAVDVEDNQMNLSPSKGEVPPVNDSTIHTNEEGGGGGEKESRMDLPAATTNDTTTSSGGREAVRNPTFATVPDGHPPFTDAYLHHPDQSCPPSGHWRGHFHNFVTTRPTRDSSNNNTNKVEEVEEHFYMFFNATPGPDVTFTFEDDNDTKTTTQSVPPDVQTRTNKEGWILVRGTGSNPFGTFELVGYLDLTNGVIEIQRQYVLMPVKRRNRRSGITGDNHSSNANRLTRKRQPSWKRKSSEDGPEQEPTPKRQRKGGLKETMTPPLLPLTTSSMPLGEDLELSSDNADLSLIPGARLEDDMMTLLPPGASVNTSLGSPELHTGRSVTIPSTNHPTSATTASAGTVANSSKRSSKTSRKRSASTGSMKLATTTSSVPSTATMNNTSTSATSTAAGGAAGVGGTTTSPHLKLPPVGEPKKARWRSAHFLYYQRNDPEDEEVKTPKYVVYEGEMANSMREGAYPFTDCGFSFVYVVLGRRRLRVSQQDCVIGCVFVCEGRGICLYCNGLLYEGQWKRNKEHGKMHIRRTTESFLAT